MSHIWTHKGERSTFCCGGHKGHTASVFIRVSSVYDMEGNNSKPSQCEKCAQQFVDGLLQLLSANERTHLAERLHSGQSDLRKAHQIELCCLLTLVLPCGLPWCLRHISCLSTAAHYSRLLQRSHERVSRNSKLDVK